MKEMLRIELHRAFKNWGFAISLAFGLVLTMFYFFNYTVPQYNRLDMLAAGYPGVAEPMSPKLLYDAWFGSTSHAAEKTAFFTLLPVLASLPFAASYFSDLHGGYLNNVCLRAKRRHYFAAKYIATFLSGGTAVTLPLFFNFMLTALFIPEQVPFASNTFVICHYSTFPVLFYTHPRLYVLLFLLIIFVFGGLLACIGLSATRHVGYSFLVLAAPFMIYLAFCSGVNLIGGGEWIEWQPLFFLDPGFIQDDAKLPILLESLVLFVATFFGFVIRTPKRDVLE